MEQDNIKQGKAKKTKGFMGSVVSGNILRHPQVRHKLPYALFIALLMFLYIMNGYHTQKLHRRHSRLNDQVKELRVKSLSFTEQRMKATRQSEILKELERRGIDLKESVTPPIIIE